MDNFITDDFVQTLVLYFCFGSIIGFNLYWIGSAIIAGVKWISRKVKEHKAKKVEDCKE